MELLTGAQIREFNIRANYFNRRDLCSRRKMHSSKRDESVSSTPGYSPAVVQLEFQDGTRTSIAVGESDIPILSDANTEKAKHYLSLILNARQGDAQAAQQLSGISDDLSAAPVPQPCETRFAVPCTSTQFHSEQEISHKGSILLKLSQLGYPVPDFVVITSRAYEERHQIEALVANAIEQLELLTMQGLGDPKNPLVFAVRCATPYYIPGVMDTYLNVGVTETVLTRLEEMYGMRAARRMFLNNLRNICRALHGEKYHGAANGVSSTRSGDNLAENIDRFCEIIYKTDSRLIHDPLAQAIFFAKYAYRHFEDNQELVLTLGRGVENHPSLILQKMVCTVRHENAYAGVISSRHTQTGSGIELQTAHNIFGEEMMTGTAEIQSTAFEDNEKIKDSFPAVYHFVPHLTELEKEFESPVTIEFAVEATKQHQWFALLQLNQTGMAGRAAITSVVDMHKAGLISRRRVTELIRPYHIKQLTSDTIDQEDFTLLRSFCTGVSVLPRSAVSARLYFSGDAALRAKSEGDKVCLCKQAFVPTDTVVMREMDAIISMTSAAVHVVTICQSLGIPALLNLDNNGVTLERGGRLVNSSGCEINEGDWITISSRRRTIFQGKAKYQPARLLRYMRGERVDMEDDEKKAFASIAYAYRYYQQLTKSLEADQLSTLSEVTRLVNFELRSDSEEAKRLVNGWFDDRETLYMEEVLKSDIGDHLGQSNVFEMLTLQRKVRFFKLALEKCLRDHISGYEAGAFMLGRFLCLRYPVAFWKAFGPSEIGLLVNEWVLFEKYMQLLQNVGERKVLLARKQILKNGLDQLSLHSGNVQSLITLKLSGAELKQAKETLPAWADAQSAKVLDLLQQPYGAFYDFKAPWSVGQLEKICQEENLPLPQPSQS